MLEINGKKWVGGISTAGRYSLFFLYALGIMEEMRGKGAERWRSFGRHDVTNGPEGWTSVTLARGGFERSHRYESWCLSAPHVISWILFLFSDDSSRYKRLTRNCRAKISCTLLHSNSQKLICVEKHFASKQICFSILTANNLGLTGWVKNVNKVARIEI